MTSVLYDTDNSYRWNISGQMYGRPCFEPFLLFIRVAAVGALATQRSIFRDIFDVNATLRIQNFESVINRRVAQYALAILRYSI